MATANGILQEMRDKGEVGEGKVVDFRVGTGESLGSVGDRSVDLVVAGELFECNSG